MIMPRQTLSKRPPTRDEIERTSQAIGPLARQLAQAKDAVQLTIGHTTESMTIELPPSVAELVLDVLHHVARGEMVTFVPYGTELSTQKAADLLNVSRPFLTSLLSKGEIDFHMVGAHRRIKVQDLLDYKKKRDAQRASALKKMQQLGQEYEAK